MKLTKSRAIGAVAEVLGWKADPKTVTVTGTPEMPIYTMQMGKVLVEVGTVASMADVPFDSRPERYGLRTVIYMELRLPELLLDRFLAKRFFFLDTLMEAWERDEYHRYMDAIDRCAVFCDFNVDAERAFVREHMGQNCMAEERRPAPAWLQAAETAETDGKGDGNGRQGERPA